MAVNRKGSAAARALAAKAVDAVLINGRNLDTALEEAGINSVDDSFRALSMAVAFGTLRTHRRNQRLINELADKPFRRRDSLIVALLSTGLFALSDARKPDYAVVSTTVDAAAILGMPRMRGVVNAILRRYLREQEALLQTVSRYPDARWLHPDWLIDRIRKDWPDDWQTVLQAGARQAPMWLRVNLLRNERSAWQAALDQSGVTGSAAPAGLPAAVLLDHPVSVSQLPGFAAGEVSVQDAASQFAAPLLDVRPGMRVLDACAAPGGKTSHILEQCPELHELVAVDQSAERLQLVEDNLQRLGLQATVCQGDASAPDTWWDGARFDRILVDAPCSATGVIRRHPDISYLRREDDLPQLVAMQLSMLEALWPLLKPGGRMLYSTCSVLREENSAVIEALLSRVPEAYCLEIDPPEGIEVRQGEPYGVHLLPGTGQGDTDGFYYALMERKPA